MFAAFAPVENAEIAVAVVSENDQHGGGGLSAAPVAGQIIEAWLKLKQQREADEALRLSKSNPPKPPAKPRTL